MTLAERIWNGETVRVIALQFCGTNRDKRLRPFTIRRRYYAGARGFSCQHDGERATTHRILSRADVEQWADSLVTEDEFREVAPS